MSHLVAGLFPLIRGGANFSSSRGLPSHASGGSCLSRASRKTVHFLTFGLVGAKHQSIAVPMPSPFCLISYQKSISNNSKSKLIERKPIVSNPHPHLSNGKQKENTNQTVDVFFLVAGRGFEPPDLRVMSPTSYQAAPPRDDLLPVYDT